MFTGGPFLATYRVQSTNDVSGSGVRCVKFANFLAYPDVPGVSFVWYGEGFWEETKYRHFGEAFQTGGDISIAIAGIAADFYGNGEDTNAFAQGLKFVLDTSPGTIPGRITISGPWNEEWLLAENNVVQEYVSPLGPVTMGGPLFDEFSLQGRWREGEGVRCKISNYSWYGAGEWRGDTYAHLATFAGNAETTITPDAFGASDICQDASFCNEVPWGRIILKPANYLGEGCYEVTGAWNEEWLLVHHADRSGTSSEKI